jgi:hypothetical protein
MLIYRLIVIFLSFLPIILTQTLKRGLAFNNPSKYIQNWNNANSQVNWAYNWDSYMDPDFPISLEFIPMLWSDSATHTSTWNSNVAAALSRGSSHILSFNEPDGCFSGQACMTPIEAVNAYRSFITPLGIEAKLGAPAVSNARTGLPWLKTFLSLCKGCQIDFVPIHWYDNATNIQYFLDYINSAVEIANGKPLWLTEVIYQGLILS